MNSCLAGLETSFISVTALVADSMAKAADIRILGFEPTGIETILIRIAADSPGSLSAALDAGKSCARALGIPEPAEVRFPRPHPALFHLNDNPNTINAIYGGREEMRPADQPHIHPEIPSMKNKAIGILETQGLAAVLEGTDAMLKAANVELVGKEKIGAAYVAITISGDVAAVTAAIDAGAAAGGDVEGAGDFGPVLNVTKPLSNSAIQIMEAESSCMGGGWRVLSYPPPLSVIF